MTQIGMSQTQIDEIELRLTGVDHRPWALNRSLYDENGRALICKGSRKAAKRAITTSALRDKGSVDLAYDGDVPENPADRVAFDPRLIVKSLALFKMCDEATEDMANFVAHAPDDVETLLNEVKFLRKRLRDAEIERDDFKKEMLALRVERAGVSDKLSDIRRVLRDFGKIVKESGA